MVAPDMMCLCAAIVCSGREVVVLSSARSAADADDGWCVTRTAASMGSLIRAGWREHRSDARCGLRTHVA